MTEDEYLKKLTFWNNLNIVVWIVGTVLIAGQLAYMIFFV